MVTLLPIEPLDNTHGMLIVEAFSRLFINGGGQEDGSGHGGDNGVADNGDGDGDGYGYNGDGYGDGFGFGAKCPEEWRVGS
jgi:hypothetical protein